MLIGQSRFEMAEKELEQAFAIEPNGALVHAYFAICKCELEKFKEARECSVNAIRLGPDQPFCYYAAAWVARTTNEFKKGLEFIRQALELDPYEPDFFAEKSQLHFSLRQWQEALDAADSGLRLDPEDMDCLNIRAAALVKLGKKTEAGDSIQSALERQPESPVTHANKGWTLLEKGDPKQAMIHFREALRLEPNLDWARVGIIEAMKGQYFIYRIVLNWFLWCSKLSGQKMWMIILGGYFGYRILLNIAQNNPAARPYVIPLIAIYLGFVVMTWVSVPLFNLVLRLNRFGRMALSDEEKRTSTWVGFSLVTALAMLFIYFFVPERNILFAALSIALMVPALAYYYSSDEGWPRAAHGVLLVTMLFLAVVMLAGLGLLLFGRNEWSSVVGTFVASTASLPLLLLGFASQFAVQFLAAAKPKRGSNAGFWVWVVGGVSVAIAAIVYIGSIWLLAHSLWVEDQMVSSAPPIRINLESVESAQWNKLAKVQSLTEELRVLGFEQVGDFKTKNSGDFLCRYFKDSSSQVVAEVVESKSLSDVRASMSAIRKEDQSLVTVSSLESVGVLPDGWTVEYLDDSLANMYQWIKTKTKDVELVSFTDQEIPRTAERIHSDQQDCLLSHGGYTADELVRLSKIHGMELSNNQADQLLEYWNISFSQQIDQLVLNRTREHVPVTEISDENVLIVHLYSPLENLATLIQDKQKRVKFMERVGDQWPNIDVANEFALAAYGKDSGIKLHRFESPVPGAVFDLTENHAITSSEHE